MSSRELDVTTAQSAGDSVVNGEVPALSVAEGEAMDTSGNFFSNTYCAYLAAA